MTHCVTRTRGHPKPTPAPSQISPFCVVISQLRPRGPGPHVTTSVGGYAYTRTPTLPTHRRPSRPQPAARAAKNQSIHHASHAPPHPTPFLCNAPGVGYHDYYADILTRPGPPTKKTRCLCTPCSIRRCACSRALNLNRGTPSWRRSARVTVSPPRHPRTAAGRHPLSRSSSPASPTPPERSGGNWKRLFHFPSLGMHGLFPAPEVSHPPVLCPRLHRPRQVPI